jgi:hypothetical protein
MTTKDGEGVNHACLKADACKVTYNEMGTKVLCKG